MIQCNLCIKSSYLRNLSQWILLDLSTPKYTLTKISADVIWFGQLFQNYYMIKNIHSRMCSCFPHVSMLSSFD